MMIKQKCPTTASGGGGRGFINARSAENSQAFITGGPYLSSLQTYESSIALPKKDKESSL
jgi:hypothetical protein